MDISLIGTDGQAINLTSIGSVSFRILESYPAGAFNFPTVEHKVELRTDGRYHLIDTIQRPIVVDLSLHVSGKSMNSWLSELSNLFQRVSFSETPMKLSVTENNKTVYLDVHAEGSSVVPNFLSSEIKLRLVSYGKWYRETEAQVSLLSNQLIEGNYSRIFRIATPANNAMILEQVAVPSSDTLDFTALASGPSSNLYFGLSGSGSVNGVTVDRLGYITSNDVVTAVSGIADGSITAIYLYRSDFGYAAGTFTRSGGSVSDRLGYIRRTSVEKPDGDGLNGTPRGFCPYRGDILAFGSFTQRSDGQNARRLVKLNGYSVTEFENQGADGDIYSVISYKDGIIIAGDFTSVGGVSVSKLCYWSSSSIFQFPLPQTNGYPVLVYKYRDSLILVWYLTGYSYYYIWNGSGWTYLFRTNEDLLRSDTPEPVKLWGRDVILAHKGIYEIKGTAFYRVFGFIDPILAARAFNRIYLVKEKLPSGTFLEIPEFVEVNSPGQVAPKLQFFSIDTGIVSVNLTNVTNGHVIQILETQIPSQNFNVNCGTGEVYTDGGVDLKSLDSMYDPCQKFRLEKGKNYLFSYKGAETYQRMYIPLQFDTLEEALTWS